MTPKLSATARRSAWTTGCLATLAGAGALVLVALALVLSAWLWRPTIAIDSGAAFTKLTLSHQPDGENAWPIYESEVWLPVKAVDADHRERRSEAATRAHADYVNGMLRGYADLSDGPWSDPTHAPGLRHLAKLREAGVFEAAARAAAAPRCCAPDPPTMPIAHWWGNENGSGMRSTTLALTAEARRLANEGDLARAVDHLIVSIQTAQHCAAQPLLIDHMVAASCVVHTLRESARLHQECGLSGEQMLSIASAFPAASAFRAPTLALEGERLAFHDVLQHIYTDDGRGDGRLICGLAEQFQSGGPTDRARGALGFTNVAGYAMQRRRTITATIDAFFDSIIAEYESRRAGRPSTARSLRYALDELAARDPPLGGCLPAMGLERFPLYAAELDATVDAFRIAAALELHREQTGRYPESLDELAVAGAAPPRTPLNQWTLKPIWYQRMDDADSPPSYRLCWRDPSTLDDPSMSPEESRRTERDGPDVFPPRPPAFIPEEDAP